MASQSDASLPAEIDFQSDRRATPDRMNRAMLWIYAQLRIAQAQAKTYETAINELRALGLDRVSEALTPVFLQAQEIGASLEALQDQWQNESLVLANYYDQDQIEAGFSPIGHGHAIGDIGGLADALAGKADSAANAAALADKADAAATAAALALKAPSASPELTGSIFSNGSQRGNVAAVAAADLDCAAANYFTKTVAGTTSFTFSNVPAGAFGLVLEVTHTSGVISFPASVKPVKGQLQNLTAGKTHLFSLTTRDGGATWRIAVLPDFVT